MRHAGLIALGSGVLLGGIVTVNLIFGGKEPPGAPVEQTPLAPQRQTRDPPPVVDSIQPDRMMESDIAVGYRVAIRGRCWKPGLQVFFGTNPSSGVSIDNLGQQDRSDRLEATVPPGVGSVQVKVRNPDGQESNGKSFTYAGDPELEFNPKELLGYYELCDMPYVSWIVDLGEIEALKGEKVTGKRRARIEAEWTRIQERYRTEREAMLKDGRLLQAYRVAERLRGENSFFEKIGFSMAKDLPFAYYIQDPKKRNPGHNEAIVAKFGSLLQEMRRIFERDYVAPLALKRQLQPELYCIAVLATPGDYSTNYSLAMGLGKEGLQHVAAHYDPKTRLAVTYEDEFTPLSQDQVRRNAILHEFVHALQHMYGRGGMPKPTWYAEGLAEFLAAGGPEDLGELSRRPFPRRASQALVQLIEQGGEVFLNSVQELVTATSYNEVVSRAATRANGRAVAVDPQTFVGTALSAFYAQSTLMIHFLLEGSGPASRQSFLNYMSAVQQGETGWETFTRAFPDVEPRQLQAEFLEYARKGASR